MGETPRPDREVAEHEATRAEAEHRTEREQRIERMIEKYGSFVSHTMFKLDEFQKGKMGAANTQLEARGLAEYWRHFFLEEFRISQEEYQRVLDRPVSETKASQ